VVAPPGGALAVRRVSFARLVYRLSPGLGELLGMMALGSGLLEPFPQGLCAFDVHD
jgi:hypothetical protein